MGQTGTPEPSRRFFLRRWLNRIEVDRAVFYSLLARMWQFLAGPVTVWLIPAHLSADAQGFYFAFLPLLAMQAFVELGMHTVTVYAVSREWARLHLTKDGQIAGDAEARSNLVGIGRQVFRWFLLMSVVFTAIIIPVGLAFLGKQDTGLFSWRMQWILSACLTGASLALQPAFSLLEGSRQVVEVNRIRVWQAITGNLVVWGVLIAGGGLWAAVASAGVRLFWDLFVVLGRYRTYFWTFLKPQAEISTAWRAAHWSLQWRIAIQSVFGYLNTWVFTLFVFQLSGAVEGGRMGMTWSILTALQAAAGAWVLTRSSLFGTLAAQHKSAELDHIFRRLVLISTIVLLVGGAIVVAAVASLGAIQSASEALRTQLPGFVVKAADMITPRLIGPGATAVFCLALVLQNVANSFGVYVRAHRQDPFLISNIVCSSIGAALVWWLTSRYGIPGAGWALLLTVLCLTLPWNYALWKRFQHQRDQVQGNGSLTE